MALYPAYTSRVKARIYEESSAIGYLFERKEHLAFGAIALCLAGAVAYFAAARADGPLRETLRTFAFRAYGLSPGDAGLRIGGRTPGRPRSP